jgi:subtilisin family serine protease
MLLALVAGLFAAPAVSRPVYADNISSGEGFVDLIVKTDGSTDAVISKVSTLGGTVNFAYENASVIAIRIPAAKYIDLVNTPGVVRVVKDRIVYLTAEEGLKGNTEPESYLVQDAAGIEVEALDPKSLDLSALPEGYENFIYTGAIDIWETTDFGAGTVVAVVDTGTVPNVCLSHAVIGAPGFPDGYNATGDGVPATDPQNHWHGTHVGGVIASACALDFSADPGDPLYQAISAYLPWPVDNVPVLGQAPLAQLYPVKVFPTSGEGVPTSIILDGLDHVLGLKRDGLLDVDVVNMSLSGPTFFDGKDIFDTFMLEFRKENILVVAAAANNGPIPNSIGSPGTSLRTLAVGALDYAPSSRVLYEYLGLTSGLGAGQGMVMRPTDEVRVTNFSSRGPMSDGRMGPDLSALGLWNFHAGPVNELRWAGGTSFSSPTVAGGAALINSYYENKHGSDTPIHRWFKSLLVSADPSVVGSSWQGANDVGFGALDMVAALDAFRHPPVTLGYPVYTGKLAANIFSYPVKFQTDVYESDTVTLGPSEKHDAVFAIAPYTSKVTIEFFDIVTPDNSAYAFWPNALEVHVQSAKRTDAEHPVGLYWYAFAYGDSFSIEIEDGPWTVAGVLEAFQPMEPGLMKVTLVGDYSNESPVSFKMRVTRESDGINRGKVIADSPIDMGDVVIVPVDIPSGVTAVTFDTVFTRNWSKFPTSDIDMLIFDSDFNLISFEGATLNAPERAVIENPAAGTYYVYIEGFEMYRNDHFKLWMKME